MTAVGAAFRVRERLKGDPDRERFCRENGFDLVSCLDKFKFCTEHEMLLAVDTLRSSAAQRLVMVIVFLEGKL